MQSHPFDHSRLFVFALGTLSSALIIACGGGSGGDAPRGSSGAGGGSASGRGGSGGMAGDSSAGAMGGSNSGVGGAVSLAGRGGSGATAGTSTGATGGGSTDMCGGNPCADHEGAHDFGEDGSPDDAVDRFGDATEHEPGTDRDREPALVYPSHETMFPINVSRIRHEWKPGGENTLFRLRFAGQKTTVNVFTSDTSWTPSEEEWDWIAESNRGGSVELDVSGIDPAAPKDVWRSEPIVLNFSAAAVEGAIYYWSTGTQGVMKALVSDPLPLKFYTDPAASDAGTCVACHTLSRDGKRLAVGYGGEVLREVSVPDRNVIVPATPTGGKGDKGMPSGWTTFSPDGTKLLVANKGVLTLIDSDSGAPIGANAGVVPLPKGTLATHPDWSALGDRVAVTLATSVGNKEVAAGSIALLPYDDGAWGEPEVIVPSAGTNDNNFFPVFSPDSRYIAYVNASGKSKDAVTATLRLVDAAGGEPRIMTRLNERVNNQDGTLDIGNSMPTWAPSTKPGTFWLAFSSLRAYASLRPQDAKEDQIWIAAVDPKAADPGYPAFWAPFQNIADGNHRAFWTHTEEDTQCRCQDECGDGLDNDCDGTADEDDCVVCQSEEICDDGIDNNCDCVIDDCGGMEICDDGIDNDGDDLADAADPSCSLVR